MRTLPGHTDFVEALAFSPRGDLLASGGADGTVRLWELPAGTPRPTVLGSDDLSGIGALAFSPDGRRLCFGTYGGHVQVVDLIGSGRTRSWDDQGRVTCATFTASDGRLAWCSYTRVAMIRRGQRGLPGEVPAEEGKQLFCLAFSPDGQTLAVGGVRRDILLWPLPHTRPHRLKHGCERGCWRLAFSPDGTLLALALADGLQIWDMTARKRLATYTGHTDVVSGVAFSPDGRRLLSCSWDGVVRLYEVVGRGDPLREIHAYAWGLGKLFDVAISPDGTLAAVGGNERDYLVIWDIE